MNLKYMWDFIGPSIVSVIAIIGIIWLCLRKTEKWMYPLGILFAGMIAASVFWIDAISDRLWPEKSKPAAFVKEKEQLSPRATTSDDLDEERKGYTQLGPETTQKTKVLIAWLVETNGKGEKSVHLSERAPWTKEEMPKDEGRVNLFVNIFHIPGAIKLPPELQDLKSGELVRVTYMTERYDPGQTPGDSGWEASMAVRSVDKIERFFK